MLFLTAIVSKAFKYFILSPIYIYLFFYYAVIILSVLYYYFYENKFSFYNVDKATNTDFLYSLKFYIIANIFFLIGCIFFYDLSKKQNKKLFNSKLDYTVFVKYKIPPYLMKVTNVIALIVSACYILTYGQGILYRTEYIPDLDFKFLVSIAKVLSFLAAIFLGLLYQKNKAKSIIAFLGLLLLTMSTGSRVTFLLLMIYLLVVFQTSGNTSKNKIRFFIQLILSFVFMSYVFGLRKLPTHGLGPYLASILDPESGYDNSVAINIYYTFIFGFFVTIRTINEAVQDWNVILVSINPLPGSMVGWYNYAPNLRINLYAPYTLHGQVFNMGITFTCLFFLIIGLIFSYFEQKVRFYLVNNQRGISLVIVLLTALFIFYSYEYYLRSALRYLYYAFFILYFYVLVSYFVKIILKRKKVPHD